MQIYKAVPDELKRHFQIKEVCRLSPINRAPQETWENGACLAIEGAISADEIFLPCRNTSDIK